MEKNDLVSAEEISRHYKIEVSFIRALSERGLLQVVIAEGKFFVTPSQLAGLEKMIRLHHELEINLEGLETIQHLLARVEELQSNLRAAQNRLRLYEE